MYYVPTLELHDPRGSLVLINHSHITKVVPRTVDDNTGPVRSIIYTIDGQRQDVAESVRDVNAKWAQAAAGWDSHKDYLTWQHLQAVRKATDDADLSFS